jgi:hypothetical protein
LQEGLSPAPEVPPSRHEASEHARDVRCRGSYLPSLFGGVNPLSLGSRLLATLRLLPFFSSLAGRRELCEPATRRGRSLGKLLWSRNRVSGAYDPYSILHLSSLGSPWYQHSRKKECCCWCWSSARPPALGEKGDAGLIRWSVAQLSVEGSGRSETVRFFMLSVGWSG